MTGATSQKKKKKPKAKFDHSVSKTRQAKRMDVTLGVNVLK